jgi:hypothetical protein
LEFRNQGRPKASGTERNFLGGTATHHCPVEN